MSKFNKDNLKPGMIVKCGALHYRVNYADDLGVGLTFVYEENFTPEEYCTYTDIPYDCVKEIVRDA